MENIPEEILIKAQSGDIDSFEIIYRTASKFVYNVAYRVLGNVQDSEEVTQEVFLKIYHNLKYFHRDSSLKTWIYRIAVNCSINYYKKFSKERNKENIYYENANLWQELHRSGTGSKPHSEAVNSILQTLNPDQRACIVLRNFEELSYRQIADTLRVSINTVRTRLKRAREKLLTMRKEVIKDEL